MFCPSHIPWMLVLLLWHWSLEKMMWCVWGNQVREKNLKVTGHLKLWWNWVEIVWIGLKCLRVRFSKGASLKGTVRFRLSLRRQLLTNLLVGQNLYQTSVLADLRVSLFFLNLLHAYERDLFFCYAQFMRHKAVIYLHQFFVSLFRFLCLRAYLTLCFNNNGSRLLKT